MAILLLPRSRRDTYCMYEGMMQVRMYECSMHVRMYDACTMHVV